MLPTKRVATLLLALLLAQVAGTAAGQTQPTPPPGSDLQVVAIEGLANRVAGVPQPITFVVKNVGRDPMVAASGWQLFIGLNGKTDDKCIDRGTAQQNAASNCYQRVLPSNLTYTEMGAGETARFTFTWTANAADANDASRTPVIHTEILPLGTSPGGDLAGCSDPDDHCENNQQDFGIVIKRPGVRAVPLRATSGASGANVNSAWQYDEIITDCPRASEGDVQRGCRAQPGRQYTALYAIKNVGNAVDTFTGAALGVEELRTRGWEFDVGDPVQVAPGATRDVRVSIRIPEKELARLPSGQANGINLNDTDYTIRWSSGLDPNVGTEDTNNPECLANDEALVRDGLCQNPSLPTLLLSHRRLLNATSNETYRHVDVERQAEFNLTLENAGNDLDSYVIRLDPDTYGKSGYINGSWNPLIRDPGPVEAHKSRNASVTLMPPANATRGPYKFDVTVQSAADNDGTTFKRLTFVADLRQRYAVSATGDLPASTVPGESITYRLVLENGGNGPDNVTLDLQSSHPGWSPRLGNATVQIPPFGSAAVTLTVTPPPNTAAGTRASFYVNATSEGPRGIGEQRVKVGPVISNLTVLQGPNLALATPRNSSFIDPGQTVAYDVLVTNVGNVASNFTLDLDPEDPDWIVTAEPTYLVLSPTQQGKMTVSVRAPQAATVGETTRVYATVSADAEAGREKQVTLEGRISGPDLFVDSVLVNASAPYSGDAVEVSVAYGNRGNKAPGRPVKLSLYFVQGGLERVIDEVTLAPEELRGGLRTGTRFDWDTTGVDGAGVLLARIDVDREVLEIEETPASNEATRAITLRTFALAVEAPEGLSGRPGQEVAYTEEPHVFLVRYDGNQPTEPVHIRIESEHGWGESELSIALPRGSVIPILATLRIPDLPGAATDTLRLTLTPTLRPGATLTATTTTTVIDEEKPRVLGVTATPAEAEVGSNVTIVALVQDATGVSSVRAFVTSPGNETTAIAMRHEGGERWTLQQPFTAPGRHRVAVEATDASENANHNATRDVVATFTMTPGSAPVIKLAADQSSVIRSGSLVRFNVTDPLGIARATYSVKGISYDLPKPRFEMDTSSFQPGSVEVAVTAENLYGVSSTARFTFTVDNTPPDVQSVSVSPEQPRANQDVTVSIRTDPQVQAVEVVIKRGGQLVETREAVRKGAGSFELTFNPPEGDYTLDVTAKDEAGNARLREGAVVFSARPKSALEVPGAGLALLALAGVAAALLARRRL